MAVFLIIMSSERRNSNPSNGNKTYNIPNIPKTGQYYINCPDLGEKEFASMNSVQRSPKIIFVGDAFVGKTTLITCFKTNKFHETYNATVGTAYVPLKCRINSLDIVLHCWDTAGGEKSNSITKQFYRSSDIACVCFAMDDPNSFKNVRVWLKSIYEQTDDLSGLFLVGCKADLKPQITDDDIQALCEELKMEYFCTSSKKILNISALVERMCFVAVAEAEKRDTASETTIEYKVSDTVQLDGSDNNQQKKNDCNC